LTVKDLAASRAFYETLGFAPIHGDAAQGWLILQNESATIGLFQGMFDSNILTFNPGWDRAAASTSSSRVNGKSRPLGVRPTPWPERPTRCRKAAIERGVPTWIARSTSPTSIPSSSDAVATSARSCPALRRCSASRRRSFERLEWWQPTASSPSSFESWAETRSASLRVPTKTSVVRCSWTSSAIRA
jgi:hypothetical protein